MRIFAASITDAADTFLHVGYLSAHPGGHHVYRQVVAPVDESSSLVQMPAAEPTFQANVAEALRLAVEPAGAAAADPAVGSTFWVGFGSVVSSIGTGAIALTLALLVMAAAVVWHVWRERTRRPFALSAPAWIPLIAAVSLLWVGLLCLAAAPPSRAADPNDGEARPAAYADPGLATQVILYGLVADGIAGAEFTPYTLSNIDDEIDLPRRELTDGETHAVDHCLQDGWGRPFEFARDGLRYTVTSVGADGQSGTGDDISLQVSRPEDASDYRPRAFFAQRAGKATLVMYRAHMGDGFQRWLPLQGKALTGSDLFDSLPVFRDVEQEEFVRSLTAEDSSLTLLYFEEPAA